MSHELLRADTRAEDQGQRWPRQGQDQGSIDGQEIDQWISSEGERLKRVEGEHLEPRGSAKPKTAGPPNETAIEGYSHPRKKLVIGFLNQSFVSDSQKLTA